MGATRRTESGWSGVRPFAGRNRFTGERYLVLGFQESREEGTIAIIALEGGRLTAISVESLEVWRPTAEWPVSEGRYWAYDPDLVRS